MRTTRYFGEQVLRKRPYLQREWSERVLANPERREVQSDGRVRYWRHLPELGRQLRAVALADGSTAHNAFPDRGFDGGDS